MSTKPVMTEKEILGYLLIGAGPVIALIWGAALGLGTGIVLCGLVFWAFWIYNLTDKRWLVIVAATVAVLGLFLLSTTAPFSIGDIYRDFIYSAEARNYGDLLWTYYPQRDIAFGVVGAGMFLGGWACLVGSIARNAFQQSLKKAKTQKSRIASPEKLSSIKLREIPASVEGGTVLGYDRDTKQPYILSDASMNTHMLVCGTTGAGKTVTLANIVESFIDRDMSVIYIDGKGDLELADEVMDYARAKGRDTHLFSMKGESCQYNPLASGGYSSKKDRLIELREWSEDHYRKLAEGYLQMVFKVLEVCNIEADLISVSKYLDSRLLKKLVRENIRQIGDSATDQLMDEINEQMDAEENITSLKAEIQNLARSEIGHLFNTQNLSDDDADAVIDDEAQSGEDQPRDILRLQDVIKNGGVAYMALSPLAFPSLSDVLGKLIVNDIKACLDSRNPRKFLLVVDEFTTLAGQQVLNCLNQGRSMGLCGIVTVQSLADLGQKIGKNPQLFVDQVMDCCNVYVVHRMNTGSSSETLSESIGTKDSVEITSQLGDIGATGTGAHCWDATISFQLFFWMETSLENKHLNHYVMDSIQGVKNSYFQQIM